MNGLPHASPELMEGLRTMGILVGGLLGAGVALRVLQDILPSPARILSDLSARVAARDRSISLADHARHQWREWIATLQSGRRPGGKKARAFVKELGVWPPVWRMTEAGHYLLKVRYIDVDIAYNRVAARAALATGLGCFVLLLARRSSLGGNLLLNAALAGAACGLLSFPVWWRVMQARLEFMFRDGGVTWTLRGVARGQDRRGQFPPVTKLEVLPVHPLAEEEMRLFNEDLRCGKVSQQTRFRPYYQHASQLNLLSGFGDWNAVLLADMGDDPRAKKAYKIKTAIELVQRKCMAERAARQKETTADLSWES